MDENRSSIVVNFIVQRNFSGGGAEWPFLFDIGNPWIAGGLLTLRDSFLPKLVSISQKASNLKMHIDKRKRCRYNTTYKQNISK